MIFDFSNLILKQDLIFFIYKTFQQFKTWILTLGVGPPMLVFIDHYVSFASLEGSPFVSISNLDLTPLRVSLNLCQIYHILRCPVYYLLSCLKTLAQCQNCWE